MAGFKENILSKEYLPVRSKDLTWLMHKHSHHSAPNHKSLDFFRGFHFTELRMDYYIHAQTSEILWKSLGIHDLEHSEGSVYEICVASG